MKWFADWIMARIARPGRSDWAQAMRAEYDTLERGHFDWAVGCLGAAVRKDISTNWLFFAALIVGAQAYIFVSGFLLVLLPFEFLKAHFYTIEIISQLPFPMLMGLWKPGREFVVGALGGFVSFGIGGSLLAAATLGGSFTKWFFDAMWMDTLPVYLGSVVEAALWAAAAWLGGAIRSLQVSAERG